MGAPDGGVAGPAIEAEIPDLDPPVPSEVTLYLHLSPMIVQRNGLFDPFVDLQDIQAFAYTHVATDSLEAAFGAALDKLIVPGTSPVSFTRAQMVKQFLTGAVSIPVTAGQKIGRAAPTPGSTTTRTAGFTVVTTSGTVDPAFFYQEMKSQIQDPSVDIEAFLRMSPPTWPVIRPDLPLPDLIELVRRRVIPNSVLQKARQDRGLPRDVWDQLRRLQKTLYRQRLLKRVGHSTENVPHFQFEEIDWRNLIQLEAIVELYRNFPEPWQVGARPLLPGDSNYREVSLFDDLVGVEATVSGRRVTLPASIPADQFARIRNEAAFIFLQSDTARASRTYHVQRIDGRVLTVDAAPTLSRADTPWGIKFGPALVHIDCFGGRVRGDSARVAAPNVVELDRSLRKVNPFFDTIYLEGDQGHPAKSYRIRAVDVANSRVTVDPVDGRSPDLGAPGATSPWRIPAGVGWELEPLPENLGVGVSPVPKGWDHFDGVLFVVHEDEILYRARWNSFTSRNNSVGIGESSLQGNKLYAVSSIRSTKEFINYSFNVTTPGRGNNVDDAYEYFNPLRHGRAVRRDPDGKIGIRIHYSRYRNPHRGPKPPKNTQEQQRGCSSMGCIVSPNYLSAMRDVMIDIHQKQHAAITDGKTDNEVEKLRGLALRASKALFNNKKEDKTVRPAWNKALRGNFWLIRPDELNKDYAP